MIYAVVYHIINIMHYIYSACIPGCLFRGLQRRISSTLTVIFYSQPPNQEYQKVLTHCSPYIEPCTLATIMDACNW